MKILEVIPVFSDSFGGPVSVVRSISKELAKKNEVTVYTTTAADWGHDFSPKQENIDGYEVNYFNRTFKPLLYSGLFGQLNLSYSMMRAVKHNLRNFDIAHVHSWQQFPDVLVHHYATKYGVPYLLQVHGSLPIMLKKQKLKRLYDEVFGYSLLRDAVKLIALNAVEAEQYRSYNVPDKKIEIIPNGIDITEYVDLPPKGSFKRKFGISEDEQIVMYLGRLHPSKRLDLLAKSFDIVAKKLDKVKLVVIGPDDGYLREFKNLLSSLQINNKVLIAGFVEKHNKMAALIDSDVFVTPFFYGFPVTFLEALFARCPIVTASNELDWINNNVGYTTGNSPNELAEAISILLTDKKVIERFRKNSERTKKYFDISQIAKKLAAIYESAIDNFSHVNG